MIINNFVCSFHACCFFYPLRKGLLVWGYLNLIRYFVMDGLSTYLIADNIGSEEHDTLSTTLIFVAILILSLATLAFCVVFIIGLHKRDERFLRPHYYYWMVTVALHIMFLIGGNLMMIFSEPIYNWLCLHLDPVMYHMSLERPVIGIFDIVVQIYFLVLVRNQIRILDKGDQRAIIDYDFENRIESRPQSMADTVRNVIETQPSLTTRRF